MDIAEKSFRIAVLGGDGIGPEVMEAALAVLKRASSAMPGVSFAFEEFSVGAGRYLRDGDPLPEETLAAASACDAILLGAMGLPEVRWPNGMEMTPQIDLREKLDLYNGVRPIKLYHESHTPLRGYAAGDIDFVIVRENCEGLFSERLTPRPANDSYVTDTMRITRHGAERIARAAFTIAKERKHHVTLADKANVLPSMVFFRKVFDEVATEFPEVRADHVYIDALAVLLLQKPESYDVIVTENMFGDIISDLAAGLVGGMGMAPSADIGDQHAVFQPAHGTAPTIAGKNLANPIGMILSVALMLRWFEHPETVRGAERIEQAVERVLGDPRNRTTDLGGTTGTREMGELVAAALED